MIFGNRTSPTPELLVVELAEEVAQVEALVEVPLVVHLGEVVEEGLVLPHLLWR